MSFALFIYFLSIKKSLLFVIPAFSLNESDPDFRVEFHCLPNDTCKKYGMNFAFGDRKVKKSYIKK